MYNEHMRAKQIERLVSQVSEEIRDGSQPLPTIGQWARRYGVCYRTMWKAAKVLEEKGMIVIRRGSPLKRPGHTSGLSKAQQRIYEDLKTDITEGHYKAGDMLPKYDFLQRTAHVSRDTIAAALQMLSTDGLVHKQGLKWFAGPSADRKSPTGVSSRVQPVILLLIGAELDWEMIFSDNFLRSFVELFRNELGKHGFKVAVHYESSPSRAFAALMPFGQDQARKIVANLGDRYRGAITFDTSISKEDFRSWVRILSCSGTKPVILFDASGSHTSLVRTNLLSVRSYYRMFLNEAPAIEIALRSLYQAGHRRIGVPMFRHNEGTWVGPRVERITSAAARLFSEVKIVHAAHEEPFWLHESVGSPIKLEALAESFRKSIIDPAKVVRAFRGIAREGNPFFQRTPSMVSLLAAGCTALIALNDWRAHQYLVWIRNARLRVPEDLSLVSFDNTAESETVPISTVDFGLARLGYLAAHILIGDIPVRADREGNIPGICTLMDRGSVAPPRHSSELARMLRL